MQAPVEEHVQVIGAMDRVVPLPVNVFLVFLIDLSDQPGRVDVQIVSTDSIYDAHFQAIPRGYVSPNCPSQRRSSSRPQPLRQLEQGNAHE